jgi:hypothetical protein
MQARPDPRAIMGIRKGVEPTQRPVVLLYFPTQIGLRF